MASTRKAGGTREKSGGRARATSPAVRPRKPNCRPGWQQKFLAKYVEIGTVTGAAEAAGVSRRTVTNERHRSEEFALAFADADEAVTESLEAEMIRRALDGSDRLIEFSLRARRPERYSDQHRIIHSGEVTGTVTLTAEQVREELAAFALPAAIAVAAGPDAIEPPENA